jgi:hypothetical protein
MTSTVCDANFAFDPYLVSDQISEPVTSNVINDQHCSNCQQVSPCHARGLTKRACIDALPRPDDH